MTASIEARAFRQALGTFTTGVTIVTTVDAEQRDIGVTANSFNSVSLDPPMVLWSLARTSSSFGGFMQAEHFAVHVLANDQDGLASRFATRGIDRFAGLELQRGADGIPLLQGCAARFQCRVAFRHEAGDHVILVGEVLTFDHGDHEPLVFKSGRYAYALPKASTPEESTSESAAPDFLLHQLGRAYHQLFARLQPVLEARRLSTATYFALSLLGAEDGRRLSELDRQISHTGYSVTALHVRQLELLGFVQSNRAADPVLTLTDAGRCAVVELMAVVKGLCDDAEAGFDRSESRLLRQFLERLIASSESGAAR